MKNYKSIFISDVHLGTKHAQADKLLAFIKENEAENFYLLGDSSILNFYMKKFLLKNYYDNDDSFNFSLDIIKI